MFSFLCLLPAFSSDSGASSPDILYTARLREKHTCYVSSDATVCNLDIGEKKSAAALICSNGYSKVILGYFHNVREHARLASDLIGSECTEENKGKV
jgi:hypothetical protein